MRSSVAFLILHAGWREGARPLGRAGGRHRRLRGRSTTRVGCMAAVVVGHPQVEANGLLDCTVRQPYWSVCRCCRALTPVRRLPPGSVKGVLVVLAARLAVLLPLPLVDGSTLGVGLGSIQGYLVDLPR